ncbi:MAG: NusG domain II-containing protein [Lachnospiraceae bacterium]
MKKRNDRMLAAVLVLFLCLSGFLIYGTGTRGRYAVVRVDGKEYGRYRLEQEQVIAVNETNRLEITGGEARMIYGDCPDQICVHSAPIKNVREMIVCMPNRVTVEICEE